MAQTNYTPISLYYSTTASAVPTAGNLVNGELAINITDGKLYFKNNSGVVTLLAGSSGGPAAGSNTQVQFNNGGVFGASSNFTWDGTTLTTLKLSATNTTDSAGVGSGAIVTAGGLGVAKNGYFGGTTLALINAAPTISATASGGGTAALSLISTGNYGWSVTGKSAAMGFQRDSVEYWFWNSTGIIPTTGSAFNLGANGTNFQNLYINYIKPVGGAAYTTGAFIDMYPSTNNYFFFHSGTSASDLNIGAAGSAAGGNISESVAYQATFSNGPGFLFSTSATAGGKLLSLTGSGVGIGKNSAAYALDIVPTSSTDGIWLKRYNTSTRAFQVTGDGIVYWGNGTTDVGQLTWNSGNVVVGSSGQLYLQTNQSVSSVNALILGTTGNATFYGNVSIAAGGNYFYTGSLASKLWTPGLQIGTGVYSGLYGPSLTYLANRSGSSWVSDGGGVAGALGIDEGYFYFARSQSVGGAGTTLTWTTYLESGSNGDFSFNSNAFTRIARGSTAQRPGTQGTGQLRWNTTFPQLEVSDGTSFHKVVTEPIILSASGGTITTDGDYKVHTFTSSGTFTLTTISGATKVLVQVMVLGGGGGGGFYLGGGGGGGAMLETVVSMGTGSYTVTVGAGGNATTNGNSYSGNGGVSSIVGGTVALYANGGGAGGNGYAGDVWGANGSANTNIGCGGGGGSPYNVSVSAGFLQISMGGPAGWNGSGGGFGTMYSGSTFNGGGGGGGAQSAGVAPNIGNGPVGAGGYGGSARPSFISGSSVSYGGGGGGGYGTYLANTTIGGGSGGGYGVGSATSGAFLQASAGSANLGGGGGGAQLYSSYQTGGNGGSGVVIVRYKFQ